MLKDGTFHLLPETVKVNRSRCSINIRAIKTWTTLIDEQVYIHTSDSRRWNEKRSVRDCQIVIHEDMMNTRCAHPSVHQSVLSYTHQYTLL